MHINGWYWTHGTFKSTKISTQHLFRVSNGVDYALLGYLQDIGCSVTFLQAIPVTHGWLFLALIILLLLRKCFCVLVMHQELVYQASNTQKPKNGCTVTAWTFGCFLPQYV